MKFNALRRANLFSLLLLGLGATQIAGHLLGSRTLRGIGAASVVSPYPKVFCAAPVHGEPGAKVETFSSRFTLFYELDGGEEELVITPEVYARLLGPYNRRNVYGAALAYGPCLPPELTASALHYALVDPASLRSELGIPDAARNARIRVTSADGRRWEFSVLQGEANLSPRKR